MLPHLPKFISNKIVGTGTLTPISMSKDQPALNASKASKIKCSIYALSYFQASLGLLSDMRIGLDVWTLSAGIWMYCDIFV